MTFDKLPEKFISVLPLAISMTSVKILALCFQRSCLSEKDKGNENLKFNFDQMKLTKFRIYENW